jgi:hypothetical protein
MEVAMACFWNGLWSALELPIIAVARLWLRARKPRVPILDPKSLTAHWRRDLGFDN